MLLSIILRTLFIIFSVFYFSEGKACPEKTRPHKTRCELYYKCKELPTKTHVWVPQKCEEGLVYVDSLKICALPGDDWECSLEDKMENKKYPIQNTSNINSDIHIISGSDHESNFIERMDKGDEVVLSTSIGSDEENDKDVISYESSGDGIDFTDGFLQASNKESNDVMEEAPQIIVPVTPDVMSKPETTTSKIDPSLKAHLQRLSQLVDGLKKTYQNREKMHEDLTPDQLNAFLAHFNIKNKFNSLDLMQPNSNEEEESSISSNSALILPISEKISGNLKNRTKIVKNNSVQLEPETKVVLSSFLPKRLSSTGYSNLVVNRPEGSVLFSLPSYGSEGHNNDYIDMEHNRHSPKLSEETLKTVLELSKQMIASQNMPKVVPHPGYYAHPMLQPLFLSYSPAEPSSAETPFSTYFNTPSSSNYGGQIATYNRPSDFYYNRPNFGHNANQPEIDYNGKPGTTIIHNNVIPVHLSSTPSGKKEVIDSYGHSLGVFPTLGNANTGSSNSEYSMQMKPYISTTAISSQPSSYDGAISTIRPPLEYPPSATTISKYFTPSPHLSESNINSLFKPPDLYPTLHYENFDSNRPDSEQSTYQLERPSPHQGSNKYSPIPAQIALNKVSIHPNSEKTNSMETEDLQVPLDNYVGSKLQFNTMQYNSEQDDHSPPLSSYTNSINKNPYMPRPSQSNIGNSFHPSANNVKYPTYGDKSKLVNIGGNFISYDVFQNNVLPLIGQSAGDFGGNLGSIEVISCQAGIRQPNITDCTRYYVCSKKDGKVLSYSCPPYTAFNKESRICDARTWTICSPDSIISYTISENKRLQMETIQALNEAKKRQEEALKAQKLGNLLNQYNAQWNNHSPVYQNQQSFQEGNDGNKNVLESYAQQAASLTTSASITTTAKPPKKFKYYCKEGEKVMDKNSMNNYFVCYKNAQGMMKGHKMTCSKGLLFCSKSKMCTLSSRCA